MRWTIYYDDGSVRSGDASEWAAAPDEGVLIVVEDTGERVNVHDRRDYYLLRDTTVMRFDAVGLHGQLKLGIPKGAIKFGRWTTNETWRAVWNRAFPAQPI